MDQTRLRANQEYRDVLKRGRSVANDLAVLYVLEREGSRRLGVSVPRRFGTAVARNRVRRLFWEAYRFCGPHLLDRFDLVIIPRRGARGKRYREVLCALEELCARSGIWRKAALS
ncbi:MAG: ribonuclease P protein component [Bacillota bacterium]|nr:ribonuclease P protein component [Bacillota bacterium]